MSRYTTIVVGTDGSESSYRAVDRAATLASESDATLVIVCAFAQTSAADIEEAQEATGEDATYVLRVGPAEEILHAAAERAAALGAGKVETVALGGRPVGVLEQIVKERAADLLIVGNRGLNTLVGRVLGSVPHDVLRHVPTDVLVVHTT